MAEPFLSEIRIMAFDFPPKGWALCNGQLLPINQNQALFALLGTTYGGNGQTTFGLPDLRSRVPIHFGSGHVLGERAGEEAHTLTVSEMPTHTHVERATNEAATTNVPTNALLASVSSNLYLTPASPVAMAPTAVSTAGGSQPHENRQPYLVLSFCIALQGIFPSQS
ncbi:phage tail protein [Acidobacteria bacterium ACD]|nr:MAG: phage tail protein [Acidobacteriota bacterium]MCE7958616.1 phage tail protein [Acidobacteria bacterium ACB2]MDL1949620.1 phage tail protein [Acidobacteria bacterium ACD]